MNDRKHKPAFSLRVGKIKAVAWRNSSKDGETSFMTYQLTRSYRKDGAWTDTDSFGIDDIPVLSTVLAEIQRRHFLAGGGPDNPEATEAD